MQNFWQNLIISSRPVIISSSYSLLETVTSLKSSMVCQVISSGNIWKVMNESFFTGTMLFCIMYFPLIYNAFTFGISSIYLYYLKHLPLLSKALTFSYYMILILQELKAKIPIVPQAWITQKKWRNCWIYSKYLMLIFFLHLLPQLPSLGNYLEFH